MSDLARASDPLLCSRQDRRRWAMLAGAMAARTTCTSDSRRPAREGRWGWRVGLVAGLWLAACRPAQTSTPETVETTPAPTTRVRHGDAVSPAVAVATSPLQLLPDTTVAVGSVAGVNALLAVVDVEAITSKYRSVLRSDRGAADRQHRPQPARPGAVARGRDRSGRRDRRGDARRAQRDVRRLHQALRPRQVSWLPRQDRRGAAAAAGDRGPRAGAQVGPGQQHGAGAARRLRVPGDHRPPHRRAL